MHVWCSAKNAKRKQNKAKNCVSIFWLSFGSKRLGSALFSIVLSKSVFAFFCVARTLTVRSPLISNAVFGSNIICTCCFHSIHFISFCFISFVHFVWHLIWCGVVWCGVAWRGGHKCIGMSNHCLLLIANPPNWSLALLRADVSDVCVCVCRFRLFRASSCSLSLSVCVLMQWIPFARG